MKIEDTLYYQAKKLYVARMRLAKNIQESPLGTFLYWIINRANSLLNRLKKTP